MAIAVITEIVLNFQLKKKNAMMKKKKNNNQMKAEKFQINTEQCGMEKQHQR